MDPRGDDPFAYDPDGIATHDAVIFYKRLSNHDGPSAPLTAGVGRHVREAIPSDSARLVAFFRTLYSETDYMLFEPGEFTVTEEQQARRFEEMSRSESGVTFVCETRRYRFSVGRPDQAQPLAPS